MANTFDPNSKAEKDAGIFGLPHQESEAALVLIPVPWDATTSYGGGTSRGPQIILEASHQVDLFDIELGHAYEVGYFMRPIPFEWLKRNDAIRSLVVATRRSGPESLPPAVVEEHLQTVNTTSRELNTWVYEQTSQVLKSGKLVGVMGGDHSSPLGAIQAIHEHTEGKFGILHIDAHADLRKAYEGFEFSHASIMYNVMASAFAPTQLVQVGIRDFCEEEYSAIRAHPKRIITYFDHDSKVRQMRGETWDFIAREIVRQLPQNVYISFDIDGLDPSLCPHTGTPVPGGLLFEQVLRLLALLHEEGKRIVGFDLNEVSNAMTNDPWDGNVGARLLYKLCGWSVITNGLAQLPIR